jgi:hypothetical protein
MTVLRRVATSAPYAVAIARATMRASRTGRGRRFTGGLATATPTGIDVRELTSGVFQEETTVEGVEACEEVHEHCDQGPEQ